MEEDKLKQTVYSSISVYTNKYNETGKYSLILNTTADNKNILAALPSMNITQQLIKGINEEYAKNST